MALRWGHAANIHLLNLLVGVNYRNIYKNGSVMNSKYPNITTVRVIIFSFSWGCAIFPWLTTIYLVTTHSAHGVSSYPDISCISVSDIGGPAAAFSVGLKVMEDFQNPVHRAGHGSVWPPRAQPWLGASQEGMVQVGVQVGRRHVFPCWHCCC